MKTRQAPENSKPAPLEVYAYGVEHPALHPEMQQWDDVSINTPDAFIHYWVDCNLRYGECVKDTSDIPDNIVLIDSNMIKVRLRGRRDFTVTNNHTHSIRLSRPAE